MSDFIIQGTGHGGLLPPFYLFPNGAKEGIRGTGPFATVEDAKQWVEGQLMSDNNIASIDKIVETTAAQVALLGVLTNRLKDTSALRDKLLGLEANDISHVNINFVTHSTGTPHMTLTASDMEDILKLLSRSVAILTVRAQDTLKTINDTAGLLHTPSP